MNSESDVYEVINCEIFDKLCIESFYKNHPT